MTLFTLIFVPAMILIPIIVAACVRTRPETGGDSQLARSRMVRLAVATVVAFALFGVGAVYFESGAVHMWPLFFPLFFGFAMPVIAAKNPTTVNVHAGYPQSVRAATLVNRVHTSPLGAGHWAVVWTIAIASLLLTISGLTRNALIAPGDVGASMPSWEHIGVSLGTLAVWLTLLVFLPWCVRTVLGEPEPMDTAGSPELARAYERHRNFKVWGFYWIFGITLSLHIGATSVAAAWYGPNQSLGILGAAGGILAGVAGAIFGMVAGVQRMRITRMLRQINERNVAAAGAM